MKPKRLFCAALLALLTLMIAVPAILGQEDAETNSQKIPRYKLVDLGTFGGRASYVNPPWSLGASHQMNRRGVTVGSAATSVPTSFGCPFCNGLDGQVFNVFHAFQWSGGIREDLGALPGELTNSVATAINAEGTVVGQSENGEIDPLTGTRELRAVSWSDGRIRNLGTFGGNHSLVADINDHGQIVGYALNTIPDPFSWIGLFLGSSNSTQTRAFLWENGHERDLGTLGGPDAVAGRINDRGEVVGISYTNSTPNATTGLPTVSAFLWRQGKMIDLGNFGGTFTGVTQINNRGQVIGNSNLPGDEFYDPFFWEHGNLVDLFTSSVGGNPINVYTLNDRGQVVGGGAFPDHGYDAFVWEKGVATDLGFLEGDCASEAFVIGSKGQIAGQSYPCTFDSQRPFLWQDGTMYDLNDLIQAPSGFRFTQAFVINDRGEIGGIGTPPGCDLDEDCGHAMLLIPCSGPFNDRDCDQREIFAVRGIPSPQQRKAASAAGRVASSRELAAKIQAKYGNRGLSMPKQK